MRASLRGGENNKKPPCVTLLRLGGRARRGEAETTSNFEVGTFFPVINVRATRFVFFYARRGGMRIKAQVKREKDVVLQDVNFPGILCYIAGAERDQALQVG